VDQPAFNKERCVFPRNDFLQCVFLCRKLSYYLTQSPHCHQVLTGVVPYADINMKSDIIKDIRHGKRPPRPRDANQNRWLQDPVWDAISTCWKNEPAYRYELSVVYEIFSTPNSQGTQGAKPEKSGDLCLRNSGNLTITELSQTLKQDYNSARNFSHGLPLSSSFNGIRSQKSRGLLMRWTR
jgi:hypothetical protein